MGDLAIYNKERDVHGLIMAETKIHSELTKKILEEGFGGIKGYFTAIVKNGKIKVNPKRIQQPQPW